MYRIARHDHEIGDTWKAGGSRCIGEGGSYTWTGGGSSDAKETFFFFPALFLASKVRGKRRVKGEMAGLRCHGGHGGRQKCIAACCFGSRQVGRDWGSG